MLGDYRGQCTPYREIRGGVAQVQTRSNERHQPRHPPEVMRRWRFRPGLIEARQAARLRCSAWHVNNSPSPSAALQIQTARFLLQ